jgi:hypothetical protein
MSPWIVGIVFLPSLMIKQMIRPPRRDPFGLRPAVSTSSSVLEQLVGPPELRDLYLRNRVRAATQYLRDGRPRSGRRELLAESDSEGVRVGKLLVARHQAVGDRPDVHEPGTTGPFAPWPPYLPSATTRVSGKISSGAAVNPSTSARIGPNPLLTMASGPW